MKHPIKEGVKELILEYFKVDVLDKEPLGEDTRLNIIETFTYAYNNHQSIKSICKELQHSNLSEVRDRIIERMGSNYNPYPIRLGEIKPELQREAAACDKSLHGYVLNILRDRRFSILRDRGGYRPRLCKPCNTMQLTLVFSQ